jgi:hypothetical protein
MDAKYVIGTNGKVAIFSKYLGLEHAEVGNAMGAYAAEKGIVGAGFCSLVGDQLITFGRSTSTGVGARPEDAAILTEMLHKNQMVLVFYEAKLGYIATNAPDDFEHTKQVPCTPESLLSARIFK